MWNNKYKLNNCVECGSDKDPHKARGLCLRCYKRKYNKEYAKKPERKVYMAKYSKQWQKTPMAKEYHKNYYREYFRKLRKENIKVRLDGRMSSAIYQNLKGIKNGRQWEGLVGYTLEELIAHLERLFVLGMNWENYGSYWHIDHIKPKTSFHYNCPEDSEFKVCWSLKNLQPLEAVINLKKGARLDPPREYVE